MPLFAVAIFVGAFLLFQVQPLIAKYVLPWFGGSPAVWTAAMLVFQVLLLVGYAYAHLSVARLTPRRQAAWHIGLVVLAVAFLPIIPAVGWKPSPGDAPTLRIVGLMLATIGLPYLALASTSPLLQAWVGRLRPGRSPYRLYALSNLGSLLALVSFPFLLEPLFGRSTQAVIWSWSFGLFVLVSLGCAAWVWRRNPPRPVGDETSTVTSEAPGGLTRFLWWALPCAASVLLLAVTNQISQDIAVVPFLWVLPLSLYLLSFIIAFDHDRWYYRPLFLGALVPAMALVLWVMNGGVGVAIGLQITAYSAALFLCAMACHGELARRKPHARFLTSFYLRVAAGGALGGVFVALIAPVIFNGFWELHLGLWASSGLVLLALLDDPGSMLNRGWRMVSYGTFGVFWAMTVALVWLGIQSVLPYDTVDRNFYGVIRTELGWDADYENGDEYRILFHGGINHGFQYLGTNSSRAPRSYFGPTSGIGLAATHLPKTAGRRIGVIGLGVGTMAAFARAGDEIRFYEINPVIESLATTKFKYLQETPADWEVVMGDGRLSLEHELAAPDRAGQAFDLFVMDAFSGDAPPVHLLTREAFELYLAHLAGDGLLVFNVTNRHIDMTPVIWGLAAEFGMQAVLIEDEDDDATGIFASSWMVVTNNEDWLGHAEVQDAIAAVPENEEPDVGRVRLWTDEYSNLFQLLY